MSKPEPKIFVAKLGNDEITFETGVLAGQAGGAVLIRSGESVLLTAATASKNTIDRDFFPLSVEFEEKLYAAGRIPGSFFRREGRPSEGAILTARLTDRPLRPLFDQSCRNEVQIVITCLSSDGEKHLDILGINSASAALAISDIPWDGPIGAIRIGLKNGEFLVNPSTEEMVGSELDLRIAGTEDAILMVEAGAEETTEEVMLEALRLAHDSIQEIISVQKEMRETIGKEKREMGYSTSPEETVEQVASYVDNKIETALDVQGTKQERVAALDEVYTEVMEHFGELEDVSMVDVRAVYKNLLKKSVRSRILDGVRPDGRDPQTVRPIWCDVGLLPRTHGSGVFTRGETQALTITTLGTPRDEQRLDTLGPKDSKRYMHHYNFPPYSVGETGRVGSPNRRAVGHGALAERALLPMIPPVEEFPYTLRLVSEVLGSNGSSSMASVCGSTLSLMDAGVPIKAPVAGVAMGLVEEGERYTVLTDIQGLEDALGDMDFKVAGTREGITALQMDIKLSGLRWEVLEDALAQAKIGRFHILDQMEQTISTPRENLSPYAPTITAIQIDPEKIGKIIGPGGKMIRAIQEETGAKIDIDDDGMVFVAAPDQVSGAKALAHIEALTEEATLGKIYTGKVVRTVNFGAFVEILPGVDGLIPISQLADYHAPSVEDVVQVGDEVMAMVINIDGDGKIRLSRQAVLLGWSLEEAQESDKRRPPRSGGGGGGNRSGGGGGNRGGGNRGGGNRGGGNRGGSNRGGGNRGGGNRGGGNRSGNR
ncbi:polyribonucleotide nucleotidyltransferase [Anaerolineales bacterium HSG25]|nr:polyribonucleotide nucleotidyltransferase [Anaerolineales bacterium HSG25]